MLFAVGFLAGFNFHDTTAGQIVLGIVLLLFMGYAFSWVFALVGLFSSTPETANSIGFTVLFPLTFASSVFVPAASMPDGLRQFAEANPFTTWADAVRSLWLGTPANSDVWMAFVWCVVLTAVFAPLAVARYRKVDREVTIIEQVTAPGALPDDREALDAYSRVITFVAESLAPSVANLRVGRRGGGSGVVITPDGFVLTNAHVVGERRAPRVVASFTDGRELTAELVGSDPLTDLALLRTERATLDSRGARGRRRRSASASWSSRSATRTASPAR